MLGTQFRALLIELTSSHVHSHFVPILHLPLFAQAANQLLRTSKRSSSTKGAGYVQGEREESDSRSVLLNEEKEEIFRLSITMGEFSISLQNRMGEWVTTSPHAVMLEWGFSLHGDQQAWRWDYLKVLFMNQTLANNLRMGK